MARSFDRVADLTATALPHTTQPAHRRLRRGRGRRRRPYGVARPGAYAAIPAWLSRAAWREQCRLDLAGAEVTALRRGVGRGGPVSVRACWAVATAVSASADDATGRNAMPGVTQLAQRGASTDDRGRPAAATASRPAAPGPVELLDPERLRQLAHATGYGRTTVQKALKVLCARGWLQLVVAGKNWLTRPERLALWSAGSKARQRRNVWACTTPPALRATPTTPVPQRPAQPRREPTTRRRPVDNRPPARPTASTGCALPSPHEVGSTGLEPATNYLKPERASRNGPPGRTPTNPRTLHHPNRAYRTDPRVVQLAKDLQARLYWLRDVPARRLMPALHRYAIADWTAHDLQTHLDRLLAARGWTVPDQHDTPRPDGTRRPGMRSAWGYLAWLLRQIDPTDLAADAAHAADQDALAHYTRQLAFGPACPHGQPGGHLASPTRGIQACPACRTHRPGG